MSLAARFRTRARTQKPQNTQNPRATTVDQRGRLPAPAAAKVSAIAVQISSTSIRHPCPWPAGGFCGGSRDFCGDYAHTAITAGQTAYSQAFADPAVSAAAPRRPDCPPRYTRRTS